MTRLKLKSLIEKDSYKTVEILGKDIVFFVPNELINWRVETLFEKEPETLDWINKFQNEEKIVFWDIGSNIGLYSIYAALKYKNIEIISFEPSTRELITFYRNLELNKNIASKIRIVPMAVGKQTNDFLSLTYGPSSNTGTNKITDGILCDEKIPVVEVGKILGEYYIKKVKLIKIDVEGFELNVVDSLQDLLIKMSDLHVVCEINNEMPNSEKIFEIFQTCGFELNNRAHLTNTVNNAIFYKKGI